MNDFSETFTEPRKKDRVSKFNVASIILIPLAAILFQVYVPRFVTYLSYLELPLLVTVYFALMRRSPVTGVLFGAGVGLAQDSLSSHPLGMFGIVKTLVGYFAASKISADSACSFILAKPKSRTFTVPSGLILMFPGFRSR